MTFFYKFILPLSMSAVLAYAAISAFLHPARAGHADAWVLLVIWVAASGFFWRLTGALKQIHLSGNTLTLSNYMKRVEVPVSEIAQVSQGRMLSIRPVFVRFKGTTAFGGP